MEPTERRYLQLTSPCAASEDHSTASRTGGKSSYLAAFPFPVDLAAFPFLAREHDHNGGKSSYQAAFSSPVDLTAIPFLAREDDPAAFPVPGNSEAQAGRTLPFRQDEIANQDTGKRFQPPPVQRVGVSAV